MIPGPPVRMKLLDSAAAPLSHENDFLIFKKRATVKVEGIVVVEEKDSLLIGAASEKRKSGLD